MPFRLWVEQGGQDPDQGTLSRTVGTEKAEDLSPSDLKRDVIDRSYGTVLLAEDLCEVIDPDDAGSVGNDSATG